MSQRFEAFWCPGLDDDVDDDRSLVVAYDWLVKSERRFGERGVIVMNAALMRRNNRTLASAPREIVSPRSARPYDVGPVLCVYPVAKTLDYAERLGWNTALCVIGGTLFDVSPWIRRTSATCLIEGFAVAEAVALPPEVAESLDHMLFFGGHNSFLGAGEKENAIHRFRAIARRRDAPTREAIEGYLHASGKTDADGVERAGKWYDEILAGKRHRDYRGQIID